MSQSMNPGLCPKSLVLVIQVRNDTMPAPVNERARSRGAAAARADTATTSTLRERPFPEATRPAPKASAVAMPPRPDGAPAATRPASNRTGETTHDGTRIRWAMRPFQNDLTCSSLATTDDGTMVEAPAVPKPPHFSKCNNRRASRSREGTGSAGIATDESTKIAQRAA